MAGAVVLPARRSSSSSSSSFPRTVVLALVVAATAAAILVAAGVRGAAALYKPDLTQDTFGIALDGSRHVLIEFYAPWCGHCKTLAPEYKKLGEAFEDHRDVLIAQVDADRHRTLGELFGVRGFPTLVWVPKGTTSPLSEHEPVDVARTADALLDFVNAKAGTSVRLRQTRSLVETFDARTFNAHLAELHQSRGSDMVVVVAQHEPTAVISPGELDELAKTFDDEPVTIASFDLEDGANRALFERICGGGAHCKVGEYGVRAGVLRVGASEMAPLSDSVRSANDLLDAVNDELGYDLAMRGGQLDERAGVNAKLSALVRRLLQGDVSIEDVKIVVQDELDALSRRRQQRSPAYTSTQYYARVAEKIADKGAHYVNEELQRLRDVLKDQAGGMKRKQERSFARRVNILGTLATSDGEAAGVRKDEL